MARVLSTAETGDGDVVVIVDLGPGRSVSVVMPKVRYLLDGPQAVADLAEAHYAELEQRLRRRP